MPTDLTQQLMLVQQKVDLLETHMNWVIGGVTLTITFLLALFAFVQFIYQKKLEEKRIKEVEIKLSEKIEKETNQKEETLKLLIENRVTITENTLKTDIGYIEAEVCRRFAIDCYNGGLFATAFNWWISAASLYAKHARDNTLFNVSVKNAKKSLEEISTKADVDILLEHASRINKDINSIREIHPVEAQLLEKIFTEKILSNPSKSVIQA